LRSGGFRISDFGPARLNIFLILDD